MKRHPFSLSFTVGTTLDECRRRYFHHVYGAWGGHRRSASPESRRDYTLKHAMTLRGWVGEIVHRQARAFIAGEAPLDVDVAVRALRAAVSNHQRGLYRDSPKAHPAVLELWYRLDNMRPRVDRAEQHLVQCMQALATNRWVERLAAGSRDGAFLLGDDVAVGFETVNLEALVSTTHQIPGAGAGLVQTVKVWLRPDGVFVFKLPGKGPRAVVLELKTGAPRSSALQVGIYSQWLRRTRTELAAEDIACVTVYLASFHEHVVTPTPEMEAEAGEAISRWTNMAAEHVWGSDLDRNHPHSVETFPQLERGAEACRWCAFRERCNR